MRIKALHDKMNAKALSISDVLRLETEELKREKQNLSDLKRNEINLEQARETIQIVSRKTQEVLEYNLNEIVTKAMSTVFDDPYEVKIEFVAKRNKTEAEIWFVRGGAKYSPLASTGGGAVDVAAFSIKLALWSLKAKKTRKCLIFDEPFKNVNDPSRELHERLSEMVADLCEELGIQIIMVSLESEMVDNSDNAVQIKKKGGRSVIS